MSNRFPDWADTASKQLLVAQAKGLNITQDAPEMLGSFDLCTRWVESREVWLRSLASASALPAPLATPSPSPSELRTVASNSGCLCCDLFLPAHDVIKLGLLPLQTVVKSQPIRGPSFLTRQFGSVFLQFKFKDQDGNEVLRGCDLEAWCGDEEYNHLISTRRSDAASSAPSLSSPPPPTDCSTVNADSPRANTPEQSRRASTALRLSPIKYLKGASSGKAVLGVPGWRKLNIHYDAHCQEKQIFMLEEVPWDFV